MPDAVDSFTCELSYKLRLTIQSQIQLLLPLKRDYKLIKKSNTLTMLLATWYIPLPLLLMAILVPPATGKKLPAVIMIHEFWGINDNIRSMARTLAKQAGYVVLAVDLFKGQSTNDPNQASQLVKSVRDNPQEAISNLQAAVKYVSSLPFVDSSKIASFGWCFGGGQSLQLALHSEQHPLAATILYYGTPLVIDKQELSKIKWPVLGIFGDHDQANPLSLINAFKAALDGEGITNEILIYKGLRTCLCKSSWS